MTGEVGLSFGYNGAGQGVFDLVDLDKVGVLIHSDKVGVRLKHAEVLAYELPGILWDGVALHGFFRILCLKLGTYPTQLASIPYIAPPAGPEYDILTVSYD